MKNIIEVKELKKNYGANSVLKGINLTVHKGEIFALLGVNGAGKTTALECIEGLRAYDSGNIKEKKKKREAKARGKTESSLLLLNDQPHS